MGINYHEKPHAGIGQKGAFCKSLKIIGALSFHNNDSVAFFIFICGMCFPVPVKIILFRPECLLIRGEDAGVRNYLPSQGVNQDCCLLRLLWLFGFRRQVSGFRCQGAGSVVMGRP